MLILKPPHMGVFGFLHLTRGLFDLTRRLYYLSDRREIIVRGFVRHLLLTAFLLRSRLVRIIY